MFRDMIRDYLLTCGVLRHTPSLWVEFKILPAVDFSVIYKFILSAAATSRCFDILNAVYI